MIAKEGKSITEGGKWADWIPVGCASQDALWLMKSKKITIIVASRRPSIEIEGYTLQSPPSGALLKPH
ncbi:MAG TPA: hypothetical protein VND68_04000, partial [Chloroflexia bacterium]|nr:hypothetical protein [Chloroflexia bacterium]